MQGSNLVFIVLPNVIPAVLFMGVASPFIADSRSGSRRPNGPPTGSYQRDLLPQAAPAGSGRSR